MLAGLKLNRRLANKRVVVNLKKGSARYRWRRGSACKRIVIDLDQRHYCGCHIRNLPGFAGLGR
jgi:hypothetical protein